MILFLSCLGLLAQTPGTNDGNAPDTALRDEILRRAVRGEPLAGPSNTDAPTPAATPTTSASSLPTIAATIPPAVATNVPATSVPSASAPAQPGNAALPSTVPPSVTMPPQFAGRRAPFGMPGGPGLSPTQMAMLPESNERATNDIQFPAVDINTFLDVYAKLVGRTVLRAPNIGNPTITLETQKPLTKSDLIQAMDTILAMNGITMVNNENENFVKAVPSAEVGISGAPFAYYNATNIGIPGSIRESNRPVEVCQAERNRPHHRSLCQARGQHLSPRQQPDAHHPRLRRQRQTDDGTH